MFDIKILRKQYNEVIESEKRLAAMKRDILEGVRSLAKFKPGDKVVWTKNGFSGIIRGIIRDVVADRPGPYNPLRVAYKVGKITKSGEIHKTHDITWSPVPEEELSYVGME